MRRSSCKSGSSCCLATHTSIESFLDSASDTAGVLEELFGLKGKHVRRDGECLYTILTERFPFTYRLIGGGRVLMAATPIVSNSTVSSSRNGEW